jgi:hypothetical protein
VTAVGHEDVGRLDIAVDDSFGVCGIERVGDLDGEGQQSLHVERAPGDAVLQRRPLEILHGDEGQGVFLADVVNGADVGMIERRGGLGLALEAAQRLRVASDFVRQKL